MQWYTEAHREQRDRNSHHKTDQVEEQDPSWWAVNDEQTPLMVSLFWQKVESKLILLSGTLSPCCCLTCSVSLTRTGRPAGLHPVGAVMVTDLIQSIQSPILVLLQRF